MLFYVKMKHVERKEGRILFSMLDQSLVFEVIKIYKFGVDVNIFFNSIENVIKKSAPQKSYVTCIVTVESSNECLNCL